MWCTCSVIYGTAKEALWEIDHMLLGYCPVIDQMNVYIPEILFLSRI